MAQHELTVDQIESLSGKWWGSRVQGELDRFRAVYREAHGRNPTMEECYAAGEAAALKAVMGNDRHNDRSASMSAHTKTIADQIRKDLAEQVGTPADRKKMHEVILDRLKGLLPDPHAQVAINEADSDAEQGKISVTVRGSFPESLIEQLLQAGVDVRPAPLPDGWSVTCPEGMEWQLWGPDKAHFRVPRRAYGGKSETSEAQVVTIAWRIHGILYPE